VREIRLHGSEGGGIELNRSFLPLSLGRWRRAARSDSKRINSRHPSSDSPKAFSVVLVPGVQWEVTTRESTSSAWLAGISVSAWVFGNSGVRELKWLARISFSAWLSRNSLGVRELFSNDHRCTCPSSARLTRCGSPTKSSTAIRVRIVPRFNDNSRCKPTLHAACVSSILIYWKGSMPVITRH
jgi:hypothetical protein